MGSWAYCTECDRGLDKPTLKELWNREQFCHDGHSNTPVGDMGEFLDQLEERIVKLEASNSRLKKQVAKLRGEIKSEPEPVKPVKPPVWNLTDDDIPF